MRHINIPIFIPHLGCPNDCVFCNQRRISGKREFNITDVESEIERAVSTVNYDNSEVEIAFFGGSFTGIDRADMLYLLGTAKKFISMGKAQAIRLSTRPDYIDGEILDILADHGVTDIELGLQSMSDRVLAASKRGHTAQQARDACRMIKSRDFNLVGQMMIGLPCSSPEDEISTAIEIAEIGCDAARIYPTVVFCETELADMMERGEYVPLTLADAVERSADVLEAFIERAIPVIRLGLQSADNLFEDGSMVGGAYHSAMGEMVYSEIYYRRICRHIDSCGMSQCVDGRTVTLYVPMGETSKAVGQKKDNKRRLKERYGIKDIKIAETGELLPYQVLAEVPILPKT